MLQTLEELFRLDTIAQMFHSDIQADKSSALLAVAGLMAAARAEYVISGGLAAQRHIKEPRFTRDVDVVVRSQDEPEIQLALARPHFAEQFQLVHRRRRWTAIIHRPSGTPIDINASSLFALLLEEPELVELAGVAIPFAAANGVAYTKLRTQQPHWPHLPDKRLTDRADLIRLLRDNAQLYGHLRVKVEATLQGLLDVIHAESSQPTGQALYPGDDDADPPLK
jgi:hypothetical protein